MTGSNTKTPASSRPPYAVAKLRRPKGACYCDHDDEECYRRGHWQPTSPMFERGGDWYVRNGNGSEHRLLDIAPTLERAALRDPVHMAARRAAAGRCQCGNDQPDPMSWPCSAGCGWQEDEWPDNALDSF